MEVDDRLKQRLCRTVGHRLWINHILFIKEVGFLVQLNTLVALLSTPKKFWSVRNRLKSSDASANPLLQIKEMVKSSFNAEALDVGSINSLKFFLLKFENDEDLVTFKILATGSHHEITSETLELAL